MRLLKLASPTPTTPPSRPIEPKSPTETSSKIPFENVDVEGANEHKNNLTYLNINDDILEGFQKGQEQPFEELKEKKAAGTEAAKVEKGALDADAQYAFDRFKVAAPKWLVVPLALMGFINMSTMYSAQQFLKTYGMEYCGLTEMKAASMSSLYTFGSLAAVIIWAIALAALRWRTLKVLVIDLCGSII